MPPDDVARQLEGAREALEALHASLRSLRAEIVGAPRRVEAPVFPERLRQVVEELGQDRPVRPVACPEEFIRQWVQFVAGRGPAPGVRGVRYLCWEADVANSAAFRRHLVSSGFDVRARSIQGLVRSCQRRWGRELLGANGAADFARQCLHGYRGPNRVLGRWRDGEDLIFDHTRFAGDMLTAGRTPDEQAAHWNVDAQSLFFLSAMEVRAEEIRAPRSTATVHDVRNILFWRGWELGRFKTEIGRTLLLPDAEQRPALRELVADILSDARLLDPRLPANAKNWVGVPAEARGTFIRWLSAADIRFFFEHVLPHGHDPHGRKPFWLRYLNRVKQSWYLLSDDDHARLQRSGAKISARVGGVGRINHATTSAFLLDFGSVLAIEFSKPGNACYCLAKPLASRIVSDLHDNTRLFDFSRLKPTSQVGTLNIDNAGDPSLKHGFRFSHIGEWEEKAARQLALMGIRPG